MGRCCRDDDKNLARNTEIIGNCGDNCLREVKHDDTLDGNGTSKFPLKVVGGGGGGSNWGSIGGNLPDQTDLQEALDKKANLLITPPNDTYDGDIADRPDEFTKITFDYAGWFAAKAQGAYAFTIGVAPKASENPVNLTMVTDSLEDVSLFIEGEVLVSGNNPTGVTTHTDANGIIWTIDSTTETGKIILVPSEIQKIVRKYINSGNAGQFVELFDAEEQVFDLADAIYEIRNSVNPRIKALEDAAARSIDNAKTQIIPTLPESIDVKAGEIVSYLNGQDSVLVLYIRDVDNVSLETVDGNDFIEIPSTAMYGSFARMIQTTRQTNIVGDMLADVNSIQFQVPTLQQSSSALVEMSIDGIPFGYINIVADKIEILHLDETTVEATLWDGTNWLANETIDIGSHSLNWNNWSNSGGELIFPVYNAVLNTRSMGSSVGDDFGAKSYAMVKTDFGDAVMVYAQDATDDTYLGINYNTKKWGVIPTGSTNKLTISGNGHDFGIDLSGSDPVITGDDDTKAAFRAWLGV